jgi:hypothetical protein
VAPLGIIGGNQWVVRHTELLQFQQIHSLPPLKRDRFMAVSVKASSSYLVPS